MVRLALLRSLSRLRGRVGVGVPPRKTRRVERLPPPAALYERVDLPRKRERCANNHWCAVPEHGAQDGAWNRVARLGACTAALPLPLAGEGWGGGASAENSSSGEASPTRRALRARRPPPQAGEVRQQTLVRGARAWRAGWRMEPCSEIGGLHRCSPSPACGGGLGWGCLRGKARRVERLPPPAAL